MTLGRSYDSNDSWSFAGVESSEGRIEIGDVLTDDLSDHVWDAGIDPNEYYFDPSKPGDLYGEDWDEVSYVDLDDAEHLSESQQRREFIDTEDLTGHGLDVVLDSARAKLGFVDGVSSFTRADVLDDIAGRADEGVTEEAQSAIAERATELYRERLNTGDFDYIRGLAWEHRDECLTEALDGH